MEWECTPCLNEKFPFTFSDDKYIISNTFSSNFDCRYKILSNILLGLPKYIFQKSLDNFKKDNSFDIIDENYTIMDDFLIQTSFKYYQNHKFHKLVEKTSKRLYLVFSAPAVKKKN